MPIEFRCNRCQRLLRTADDTVGKQTKCPECAAVLTIPDPTAPPPRPVEPYLPAGSASNPYLAPAGSSLAAAPGGVGVVRPAEIEVGEILGATWKIFTDKLVPMLVGMVVLFAASLLGLVPLILLLLVGAFICGSLADAGNETLAVVVAVPLFLLWMVLILVFSSWLYAGIAVGILKIARGQTAEISDLFSGARWLGAVTGASLLFTLAFYLGLAACIVPGILVAVACSQFLWLIVDRNASAVSSLSMSRDLTRGHRLNLFLLMMVALGIHMLASFVPGATLFTTPFFYLMGAVVYLRLTGQPTAAEMMTAAAPAPVMR